MYRGRPLGQFHIREQELDMTDEGESAEAMKISAMLEAYEKVMLYGDTSWKYSMNDVEKFMKGEIDGRKFIAYFDLRPIHNNKVIIVDHKIIGKKDRSVVADRFQICTYFYLDPKAEQFALNMLIKPYKVLTKAEKEDKEHGLEHYRKRVLTELLAYPKKYFIRKYYYRSEFDLDSWRNETQIKLEELEGLPKEIEHFYPNEGNCRILECEFQSICETGVVDWDKFKKKGMRK